MPAEHLDFLTTLPHYHEDEFAIYVHAGLDRKKHPRDTSPQALLWMRDMEFYKNYKGKPCIFGHTPTPLLPLLGRLGRHGIYISHSAIGIDTGYNIQSPLSCLSLPDFTLYQSFADGREESHHITAFIPETLKAMHSPETEQGPAVANPRIRVCSTVVFSAAPCHARSPASYLLPSRSGDARSCLHALEKGHEQGERRHPHLNRIAHDRGWRAEGNPRGSTMGPAADVPALDRGSPKAEQGPAAANPRMKVCSTVVFSAVPCHTRPSTIMLLPKRSGDERSCLRCGNRT